MDDERVGRRLKPWHVALTLTLVGVIGAVSVMFAARSIETIDRKDIENWEAVVLPPMAEVMGYHAKLIALGDRATAGARESDLDPELNAIRRDLQAIRRPLQERNYPRITFAATGRYLTALGETLAALAVIENAMVANDWDARRFEFDKRISAASSAYNEGAQLRQRLRARARIT